ncbi:hypothetical protein HF295_04080 [Hujiaoplasma nucleasis]|uniref:Uncharacterized protein n=1 Tax=Hujiaoplasma nucleasis TaxID=2725268 RepID=A0A7L6N3Q4_9MOLU|nr:hypothetical protein [Hujiaoplasma nucleasis]QLY40082.1 hypothetical protein HF295_04080 [Hujiaoplasma nucleasis]
MKRRLHLSLAALVGSVLLFIVTSLAWFSVSEWVNVGMFQSSVSGYSIDYTLYESTDGLVYNEIDSIQMSMQVPGDEKYFRLVLSNPSSRNYDVIVYLSSINDVLTNGSISLIEVIQVTSTVDGLVNRDDTLENLMSGGMAPLINHIDIEGSGSETIDFTLGVLPSAGNEYQGLEIEIDDIRIYFNAE